MEEFEQLNLPYIREENENSRIQEGKNIEDGDLLNFKYQLE